MNTQVKHLEHTADLALQIHGRNLRELFEHAAQAMFSELADLKIENPTVQRPMFVHGLDYESLLVNWLNELLFWHETQGEVYSVFEIQQLSRRRLKAVAKGSPSKNVLTIIKAATYHQLAIAKTADGYVATVVFDV